jgi:plastocyanin
MNFNAICWFTIKTLDMKKSLLSTLLCAIIVFSTKAQTSHTISSSGLSYTPSGLTVNQGDQIVFDVGGNHPTVEVSQSTWDNNGTSALSGGFSFPSGSGSFTASEVGTHYYVCTNHVGSGMKGTITVTAVTSVSSIPSDKFKVILNKNELSIEAVSDNLIEISLFNVLGNEVVSAQFLAGKTILFEETLQTGMYILQLKQNNEVMVDKYVIR